MKWLLVVLTLFMHANVTQEPEVLANLSVHITNLKSQKGNLALSLYRSSEGWPDEWQLAELSMQVPIDANPQEIILQDIPVGKYAVAVFHDENSSGAMDKNLVGAPKEGYGVSNNARAGLFGPPKFEEAQFDLDRNGNTLDIEIRYK